MEEYRLLCEGHAKKERVFWEIARWEQYYQTHLSPYVKSQHQPRRVTDIMRFPWDTEEKAHTPAAPIEQDTIEALNRFLEIHRNNVTTS